MADSAIDSLVILGAGGDLTSRLLLPGLASLLASKLSSRAVMRSASELPWRTTWKLAALGLLLLR